MGNSVAARDTFKNIQGETVTVVGNQQRIVPISDAIFFQDDLIKERLVLPSHLVEAAEVSRCQKVLIRYLDLMGAILGLLVLWPFFLLVALAVRVDSSGPVIYKQKRVGERGKIFTLYKFRTMVAHAEKHWGFMPASEDDERVTAVGRLLRKTRLDELPQLLNVLKGDMSLVGPRPENLYRVNLYQALRGVRLAVKPGITGLAQIRSLYDLKPNHKLRYDYLYIQKRSFLLNLYILFMTVPVVLKKSGW